MILGIRPIVHPSLLIDVALTCPSCEGQIIAGISFEEVRCRLLNLYEKHLLRVGIFCRSCQRSLEAFPAETNALRLFVDNEEWLFARGDMSRFIFPLEWVGTGNGDPIMALS